MKKMKLFALMLILHSTLFAADGIRFENMKWADIKAKALKEKKMIFLDAFASWCGPCKYMEENVYTDQKTADYFNENYINVKIDMEIGEGPALSDQFGISAYPTFLFFTADGKLVHKSVGALDAEEFIELGKNARIPDQQYFTLKTKARAGQLTDASFLVWAEQAGKLEDADKEELVKKFLATKKDIFANKEIASLVFYHAEKSDQTISLLLKNRQKLCSLMSWDSANADLELYDLVFSHSLKAYTRNNSSVDSFVALYRKLYPSRAETAKKDILFRIQLFVKKDAAAAMRMLISYLKETENAVSLETVSNWMIDNVDAFDRSDFVNLALALQDYKFRKTDTGKECWIYLMQMMAAAKLEKAEKAKEFALKAYQHPNLPEVYKTALRSNYELK